MFEAQCHFYTRKYRSHYLVQLADAKGMKNWLEQGVKVIYFGFCGPVRPEGLLVLGFEGERLLNILTKRQPIELYAPYAGRLR